MHATYHAGGRDRQNEKGARKPTDDRIIRPSGLASLTNAPSCLADGRMALDHILPSRNMHTQRHRDTKHNRKQACADKDTQALTQHAMPFQALPRRYVGTLSAIRGLAARTRLAEASLQANARISGTTTTASVANNATAPYGPAVRMIRKHPCHTMVTSRTSGRPTSDIARGKCVQVLLRANAVAGVRRAVSHKAWRPIPATPTNGGCRRDHVNRGARHDMRENNIVTRGDGCRAACTLKAPLPGNRSLEIDNKLCACGSCA